ncbi:MAG: acyl carrier protein [Bacteroidetes bacterium]|nr:acyl carrier protein [Bacteroidota bacterium]
MEDTKRNIEKRIIYILVEKLGIAETAVTPDANLSLDLGIDSLDYAELIMEFEQEFDIRIPHQDTEQLASVKDVEIYIQSKMK